MPVACEVISTAEAGVQSGPSLDTSSTDAGAAVEDRADDLTAQIPTHPPPSRSRKTSDVMVVSMQLGCAIHLVFEVALYC